MDISDNSVSYGKYVFIRVGMHNNFLFNNFTKLFVALKRSKWITLAI